MKIKLFLDLDMASPLFTFSEGLEGERFLLPAGIYEAKVDVGGYVVEYKGKPCHIRNRYAAVISEERAR